MFFFIPRHSPRLTLLHVSLETSKVLGQYFQVGSLRGFSGVSVGVFFAELCLSPLLPSNAPEMSPNREQQCVKKAF